MTKPKKSAKEILDEVRLSLGIETPQADGSQEPAQAAGAPAANEPQAAGAPAAETPKEEPQADSAAPLSLADMQDATATLDVINALCSKVWTLSNTISALSTQLSDAQGLIYSLQEQQKDASEAVALAEQKETKTRQAMSELVNLVEQLAELPTGEPAEAPKDKLKKVDVAARFSAAFQKVKQNAAQA